MDTTFRNNRTGQLSTKGWFVLAGCVLLLATIFLAVPAVSAATTTTVEYMGTISQVITITSSPASVQSVYQPGINTISDATITYTSSVPVHLSAVDAMGNNKAEPCRGFLTQFSPGAGIFTNIRVLNPFSVQVGTNPAVRLQSPTPTQITSSLPAGVDQELSLKLIQEITVGEPPIPAGHKLRTAIDVMIISEE
jgi:hypothetical protein